MPLFLAVGGISGVSPYGLQSFENFLGGFLDLALFVPGSSACFLYCLKPLLFQNVLLVIKLLFFV
jgi:hypothetical protein